MDAPRVRDAMTRGPFLCTRLCRPPGRFLLAALVLVASAWLPVPTRAQQQDEASKSRVPVEDFFRAPLLARPRLAPGGRYLAAAIAVQGGPIQLAVLDLELPGPPKVVAGFNEVDVYSYQWVNDQRLVFDAIDRRSGASRPMAPGLWAVNRDGSEPRQLIKAVDNFFMSRSMQADRTLPWEWHLHSVLRDGSDDVLVEGYTLNNNWEVADTKLSRLDTKTGVAQSLSKGAPDHVTRWVVDRQGNPVVVNTWHQGRFGAQTKAAANEDWQRWQDADGFEGSYVTPFWMDSDGKMLGVSRRGADTSALFSVDAKTRAVSPEPLIRLTGYDFSGTVVYDPEARRLMGVHYEIDAPGSVWFGPLMQAAQSAVDAALPGTVNRIDCERCTSVPTMLITAVSDREPPRYYVYNREKRTMGLIAASRRWIKPEQMGRREVHRFAARDGLAIPVLVTHPIGGASGPRPAVVLVHGGPWVRGTHWPWEPEAQFLASRGYVVIEPEFRGSQGYGFKLFRAGWKQWGLAMQDDVADAVQWASERGWIDSKRVCIAGASYGGYAVLMGLVRNHDLYKCGIEWVGVTDVELMYSITWSDMSEEGRGYTLPTLIGDRVADADQLKATSPLEQASKVRRPLLMAYGVEDRRVPVKHGTEFRDAVRRTNNDVEWVEYPDEGHGWRKLATNVDFWTRVEKFLERNIGAGAK